MRKLFAIATLIIAGVLTFSGVAFAADLEITANMNSSGVSVGDVRVTANLSSEVFCVWLNGSPYGDGTGRQSGAVLPQYHGIGEAWSQALPIVSGSYVVKGIDPGSFIDCPTLATNYTDYASFIWDGSEAEETTDETYFIAQSISTSTRTITVTGHISENDFVGGVNYNLIVNTPVYSQWDSDSFVATTSGYFSWSYQYVGSYASTTIEQFTFNGSLWTEKEACNEFYDSDCGVTLDTFSTTTYPGGVSTPLNPFEIEEAIASNCTPWSDFWSIGLCIQYLLYPSSVQIEQNIVDLRTEFLTRAPMGYVTRIYDIVNSTSTVSLPEITMPIPGSTQSLNLTPWELLFGDGSLLASASSTVTVNGVTHGSGETLREITETYWNFIWYVLLGFAILHDVIGVGRQNNGINKYGGVGDKPYGPQKP